MISLYEYFDKMERSRSLIRLLASIVSLSVQIPLILMSSWMQWWEPAPGTKRSINRFNTIHIRVGQWRAWITEKQENTGIFQIVDIDEDAGLVTYVYLSKRRGRRRLRHVEQHSTLVPRYTEDYRKAYMWEGVGDGRS